MYVLNVMSFLLSVSSPSPLRLPPLSLSVSLPLFGFLFVSVYICLSVCLFVRSFVRLSVCLSVCLPLSIYIYLSLPLLASFPAFAA